MIFSYRKCLLPTRHLSRNTRWRSHWRNTSLNFTEQIAMQGENCRGWGIGGSTPVIFRPPQLSFLCTMGLAITILTRGNTPPHAPPLRRLVTWLPSWYFTILSHCCDVVLIDIIDFMSFVTSARLSSSHRLSAVLSSWSLNHSVTLSSSLLVHAHRALTTVPCLSSLHPFFLSLFTFHFTKVTGTVTFRKIGSSSPLFLNDERL